MLSFHNDPAVKQKYVDRLKEHHRLDQIIQGTGYDGSRGCMVGCTLNNYNHEAYPEELGLPQWYAHLCDKIFEGLPTKKAPKFAMDGLISIPVGVSIEPVQWQLAILRHKRDLERLEGNVEPYAQQCRDAINQVISYCESELAGTAAESAESAARSAAWSASRSAESAARSAAGPAGSAAESAAWSAESAAWSAAWPVESAAWSAAWPVESAAWSAARSAAFEWEAETLVYLLQLTGTKEG